MEILIIKLESKCIDRIVIDVQVQFKATTDNEDNVGSKRLFQSIQVVLSRKRNRITQTGFKGGAGGNESLLFFFVVGMRSTPSLSQCRFLRL